MKYLFSLGLVVILSNPFDLFAQAMYSKTDLKRILETYNEVIVNMPGWEYKYSGNWISSLTIEGDYTATFTRGKITHSYDLSKAIFIQEEGTFVKVWLK
ncbi:MAG: hypothetical protein K9G46_12635 [Flavobacteriales bacterium]|nr:hypothetical protein [Flavobacteriales bacterium]MCF8461565.1 hypothetical protein [Flavobacteriales bacterium]